jgi:methionyl-tRNA formyltransferase
VSQNQAKIVFFGTSDFAVPALNYLVQNGYNITEVVTQPEKPAGRQRITMPSPVKKAALEHNINVIEPHNLKTDEEFFKHFKHLSPDICIVAAYGKMIPAQYLDMPKYGFINIHPSLLPKYRGPSPIQTAIMNGDLESGVSIMIIDEQMDHGPILGITDYVLGISNSYKETEKELAELGGKLLLEVLPKYLGGEIKPKEQDHSKAAVTKLLERVNGKIDWNITSGEIYNQIRALNPEPGTWTTWKGKVLNIKTAEPLCLEVSPPNIGEVRKVDNNIVVATKKCYLILKQIQLEGGKEMDAKSFVNGHPDFLGSKLE